MAQPQLERRRYDTAQSNPLGSAHNAGGPRMQSPPPPPPPSGGMVPAPPPPGGPMQAPGGYIAPQMPGQTTYGGFWIRVVARLLDGLVVGIPFAILFGIVFVALGVSANSSNQITQQAGKAVFGGEFTLLHQLQLAGSIEYCSC